MALLSEAPWIVNLLLEIALFVVSLFLILLVLVQRGKGGGLTGALGGMGGTSAFGTKAGDTFTRFTIGSAIVWILLCLICIQVLGPERVATAPNPPALNSTGDGDTGGMGSDETGNDETDDSATSTGENSTNAVDENATNQSKEAAEKTVPDADTNSTDSGKTTPAEDTTDPLKLTPPAGDPAEKKSE
jgi:preprotein translocase subunit SecG